MRTRGAASDLGQSIQWMSFVKPHELVSTVLIRTLMDQRYFHGIRTAAAAVLAKNAKIEVGWIGSFHLEKAFQEFFCYPNSPMTRTNDFTDRASYYIQCAISQAIAKIRNANGHSPFQSRNFLYEKLKFNDNSNNEVRNSDSIPEYLILTGIDLRLPLCRLSHERISRSPGF